MGRIALSAKGIGSVDFTDLGLVLLVHGCPSRRGHLALNRLPSAGYTMRPRGQPSRSATGLADRHKTAVPHQPRDAGAAIHELRAGFRCGLGVGTATTRFHRVHWRVAYAAPSRESSPGGCCGRTFAGTVSDLLRSRSPFPDRSRTQARIRVRTMPLLV